MGRVQRAVAACDASPSAPVVIFVSKMIPVKNRDITDTDGQLWRSPEKASEALEDGGDGGGHAEEGDDRDSLAFVAFARVLSGTVTPDTPLLVSGRTFWQTVLSLSLSLYTCASVRASVSFCVLAETTPILCLPRYQRLETEAYGPGA